MATTVVRPVGYTGTLQQLEWNYGNDVQVTAYLWGGGGGGGGNDSARGGSGSGGGYSVSSFTVNNGDIIKVAVGGKGGAGGSYAGGAAGGAAGSSWIPSNIFDTRIDSPINYTDPQGNYYPATPTYPYTNGAWCGFLNAHGVWYSNPGAYSFQNWYRVDVPTTGNYLFTFSTDNYGSYYIANVVEQTWQSYTSTSQRTVYMTAGTYYIFITGVNVGSVGAVGLTIGATGTVFDSRTAIPNSGVTVSPVTYEFWLSWFNQHAVQTSSSDVYYTVYFPTSRSYDFSIGADFGMSVYVDSTLVASCTNYAGSYADPSPASTTSFYVAAGVHTVRVVFQNDGGTSGWALTIDGVDSGYSGGSGGRAGYSGSSGGGGGGGGATVVLLNITVVSIAGGGGGGGGGGNRGAAAGQNAPGTRGQSAETPGQNGEDKSGDGGGGGGGGGGYGGGQGGAVPSSDQGGYAGSYGTGNGTTTENPSNRTPAGTTSPYFSGGIGQGGLSTQPGTAGYAVFVFDLPGVYVNQGGTYTPVSKVWVKDNGTWKQPRSIYVKNGGTWREVIGGMPPIFTAVNGNFGVNSRLFG